MKKLTKIYARILLLFLAIIVISIYGHKRKTLLNEMTIDWKNPTESLTRRESFSEHSLLEAYNRLTDCWYQPEAGIMEYPDYYVGAYIDDGILYVCCTELSEEILDEMNGILGEYKHLVEYREGGYSRNELQSLGEQLADKLRQNELPWTMWGIDEQKNCISIGFDRSRLGERWDTVLELVEEYQEKGLPIEIRDSGAVRLD